MLDFSDRPPLSALVRVITESVLDDSRAAQRLVFPGIVCSIFHDKRPVSGVRVLFYLPERGLSSQYILGEDMVSRSHDVDLVGVFVCSTLTEIIRAGGGELETYEPRSYGDAVAEIVCDAATRLSDGDFTISFGGDFHAKLVFLDGAMQINYTIPGKNRAYTIRRPRYGTGDLQAELKSLQTAVVDSLQRFDYEVGGLPIPVLSYS